MKKFFMGILFLSSVCHAQNNACSILFDNLPDQLKQDIPQLTWVDLNPENQNAACEFILRYYPCNPSIQKKINAKLSDVVKESAISCTLKSHGEHHRTEGYCTLENILTDCI